MLQTNANALTVAEDQSTDYTVDTSTDSTHVPQQPQSQYDDAQEFALEDYSYPVPGFVRELLAELEKEYAPEDARLVDDIDPNKDIEDGMLVAFPDESLLFLGSDPTTTDDTLSWYGFTIEPTEPIPAPESASDALDLLKPPEVRDTIATEDWIPNRHGEWWLLPTRMVPRSTTFNPGVGKKPFGPSPLGNHVPQEYAFTVPDDVFMQSFRDNTNAPSTIQTPPEAIQWTWRQVQKPHGDELEWADVRQWADNVLVKGSIYHRENDHYRETCDVWHKAVTHRMEVYTADSLGEGVHLDYYGT